MFVKLCVGKRNGKNTEQISLSAITRVAPSQEGWSEVHVVQPMPNQMKISGERVTYVFGDRYTLPSCVETGAISYYAPHDPETVQTALAMYRAKLAREGTDLFPPMSTAHLQGQESKIWTLDLSQAGKIEMTPRIVAETPDLLICDGVSIVIKRPDAGPGGGPRSLPKVG